MTTNAEHFGARLQQARIECEHSLRTLGKAIDRSYTSLCHIEQGRQVPRVDTLRDLCIELDVSADWLLGLK